MSKKTLYIFLDEGGNLDFSSNGTKYFTISSITKVRPFYAYSELTELKYNLIEKRIHLEYFHASEDKQVIRDDVFNIINKHFTDSKIDSIIIEKRKAAPAIRDELRFFPDMLGYLLSFVLKHYEIDKYTQIIIFTDTIPVKNKRNAVEKAIKKVLAEKLPENVSYSILHHSSKSCPDLQIADYCNWAIYRKWEKGDTRSYDLIKKYIRSEFDIFKTGDINYY